MIVAVTINSRLDADLNLSHRTEVIVNSEEEAREAGKEFCGIVFAFNAGLQEKAQEDLETP